MTRMHAIMIATFALAAAPAAAQGIGMGGGLGRGQPGSGPVVAACQAEIARHCAGVRHITPEGAGGGVRACLAKQRARLSPACRAALDGTGPGSRGMGRRSGGMGGQAR